MSLGLTATKRGTVSNVCVCVCVCVSPAPLDFSLFDRTEGILLPSLSGTGSLRSLYVQADPTNVYGYICVCVCVKRIRGAAWSGNRLVARLPAAKHDGNTALDALESEGSTRPRVLDATVD